MAAHLLVYALPLRDINDNVVVGGTIEFFEPGGSSTPKSVWSNYTLTTGAGTTVDTDAYGMPEKSSTSIEVYGDGDYYVIYKDSGGNIIRDYEWLEEIFTQTEPDEWVTSNLTPTYISATTFSVPGDQTEVLDVGRILKIQLSSSIIYRRIEVSAYTTVTTITVATGLTSPITSFEYSFLNGTNQSVPDPINAIDLNVSNDLVVSGDVDALTGTIDTFDATTITKVTTPVYGSVTLDTPELVLSTSTPATTATAVSSTTLDTAGAVSATFHLRIEPTNATNVKLYAGSSSGISALDIYLKAWGIDVGTGDVGNTIVEFTVNLDANNDFWYFCSTGTIATLKIHLVKYYV